MLFICAYLVLCSVASRGVLLLYMLVPNVVLCRAASRVVIVVYASSRRCVVQCCIERCVVVYASSQCCALLCFVAS